MSPTTVLLGTTLTRTIKPHKRLRLLGSNHLPLYENVSPVVFDFIAFRSQVKLRRCNLMCVTRCYLTFGKAMCYSEPHDGRGMLTVFLKNKLHMSDRKDVNPFTEGIANTKGLEFLKKKKQHSPASKHIQEQQI